MSVCIFTIIISRWSLCTWLKRCGKGWHPVHCLWWSSKRQTLWSPQLRRLSRFLQTICPQKSTICVQGLLLYHWLHFNLHVIFYTLSKSISSAFAGRWKVRSWCGEAEPMPGMSVLQVPQSKHEQKRWVHLIQSLCRTAYFTARPISINVIFFNFSASLWVCRCLFSFEHYPTATISRIWPRVIYQSLILCSVDIEQTLGINYSIGCWLFTGQIERRKDA